MVLGMLRCAVIVRSKRNVFSDGSYSKHVGTERGTARQSLEAVNSKRRQSTKRKAAIETSQG